MSGIAAHFRKEKKRIGCIWLDAHSDMNTPETSPSGNVHGMPLSAIMGYGTEELRDLFGFKPKIEPQNVCWSECATWMPTRRNSIKKWA